MKCFWCGEERDGLEFSANGEPVLICSTCVLEALLASLRLNRHGLESFTGVATATNTSGR